MSTPERGIYESSLEAPHTPNQLMQILEHLRVSLWAVRESVCQTNHTGHQQSLLLTPAVTSPQQHPQHFPGSLLFKLDTITCKNCSCLGTIPSISQSSWFLTPQPGHRPRGLTQIFFSGSLMLSQISRAELKHSQPCSSCPGELIFRYLIPDGRAEQISRNFFQFLNSKKGFKPAYPYFIFSFYHCL